MAITLGIDPALVLFESDRDRLAVRVAAALVAQADEKARTKKASAPSSNNRSIDDDD